MTHFVYLQLCICMKIYIYGLYEENENQLRYIGASKNPEKRFYKHWTTLNDSSPKGEWIRTLKREGRKPKLKILEETDESNARIREQFWIDKFLIKSPILNYPHSGYSSDSANYNTSISIRVNKEWLDRIKEIAEEKGMSYQTLMKSWITERIW